MAEFRAFLDWVTGTRTMRESAASIGVSRQAFASRVAWCWNVRPSIAPDGVVHHYIEADGTYVPYGWCLLVATGEDGGPLAWQWCDRENAAAYRGLFGGIARPDVLVTDGARVASPSPGSCGRTCACSAAWCTCCATPGGT